MYASVKINSIERLKPYITMFQTANQLLIITGREVGADLCVCSCSGDSMGRPFLFSVKSDLPLLLFRRGHKLSYGLKNAYVKVSHFAIPRV